MNMDQKIDELIGETPCSLEGEYTEDMARSMMFAIAAWQKEQDWQNAVDALRLLRMQYAMRG